MRSTGYKHKLAHQIVVIGRDSTAYEKVDGDQQCERSQDLCITNADQEGVSESSISSVAQSTLSRSVKASGMSKLRGLTPF
jgi:hypothetical protein